MCGTSNDKTEKLINIMSCNEEITNYKSRCDETISKRCLKLCRQKLDKTKLLSYSSMSSKEMQEQLLKFHPSYCFICGVEIFQQSNFTIEHIYPKAEEYWSDYGKFRMSCIANMKLCCVACNEEKSDTKISMKTYNTIYNYDSGSDTTTTIKNNNIIYKGSNNVLLEYRSKQRDVFYSVVGGIVGELSETGRKNYANKTRYNFVVNSINNKEENYEI